MSELKKTHTSPVKKTYAKVVWDIIDVMDGYDVTEEEAQEWRAVAKEVLGDAWDLLQRGSSSPFLQSHSLLDFSRVMTTICRERIAGTIHTPLKKYVQQLGTS